MNSVPWYRVFSQLFAQAHASGMTEQAFDDRLNAWVAAGGDPAESARLYLSASEPPINVSPQMLLEMFTKHSDHANELKIIAARVLRNPLP